MILGIRMKCIFIKAVPFVACGQSEENIENIEFLFLPPYSPERNPIEHIWRITQRERTHNVYFDKLELLRERLLTYFMQFPASNIRLRMLRYNYNYLRRFI
jgi:transposase